MTDPMPERAVQPMRSFRTREAVGVFSNPAALELAVQQLVACGFDKSAISVLGSDDEIRKRLGHFYHNVEEIEDDARVPRSAFTSAHARFREETAALALPLYVGGLAGFAAVAASGGALALAIAGAIMGIAAGAGIGGLLTNAISEHHFHAIQERLALGGLVLWVKVADRTAEWNAVAILKKAGAHHVHLHQVHHTHEIVRSWKPG